MKKHKPPSLVDLIKKTDLNLLKWMIVVLLGTFVLLAWVFYEQRYKPDPSYYAIVKEIEYKKMIGLKYPNRSTNSVLRWAVEAATAAYKIDFNNYARQLNELRVYFTPAGYESFLADFKKRSLPGITSKKLIVSSAVTGTPVVLREGRIVSGLYAWEIQLPMIITYESQSDIRHTNVIVTLLITQVSTVESPLGIGIASFVTSGA